MRLLISTLVVFSILFGCKGKNVQSERLLRLKETFGFKFYRKIDFFNMLGIDSIDINDQKQILNYPYYGLLVTSDKVDVQKFIAPNNIESRTFKVLKTNLIATNIEEDEGMFLRTINIVNKSQNLIYEYHLIDNHEYLQRIIFKYPDSQTTVYDNYYQNYHEFEINLSENEMKTKYPSFYKDSLKSRKLEIALF